MGTTLETLNHNELTIKIVADYSPESPRDWDNLGTILADHRRYSLADANAPVHLLPRHGERTLEGTARDVELHLKERVLWLPVRMYEHGSVGLRAIAPDDEVGYPWNCQWDSGWVGIIYVPYSKLRTEYSCQRITGKTLTKARDVLKAEIETYSQYINGEVYGYEIEDEAGSCIDSCYGFYGWEYVQAQAIEAAKHHSPLTVESA
jgi:hypothetical protein